ncbi:hypothetical protein BD414DRAFT_157379 [Trametes punicea]|nr:hypothetical protein BD414DRAFT_157379 [Trametes punicea]
MVSRRRVVPIAPGALSDCANCAKDVPFPASQYNDEQMEHVKLPRKTRYHNGQSSRPPPTNASPSHFPFGIYLAAIGPVGGGRSHGVRPTPSSHIHLRVPRSSNEASPRSLRFPPRSIPTDKHGNGEVPDLRMSSQIWRTTDA